jgi:hypothetical protein
MRSFAAARIDFKAVPLAIELYSASALWYGLLLGPTAIASCEEAGLKQRIIQSEGHSNVKKKPHGDYQGASYPVYCNRRGVVFD